MPRFSLSPTRPTSLLSAPDGGVDDGSSTYKYRESAVTDDTDYESSSSSSSSSDDDSSSVGESESSSGGSYCTDSVSSDSNDDSYEEEPPHPLGFPKSYGRTRFVLDPPTNDGSARIAGTRASAGGGGNKVAVAAGYEWFDPADWDVYRNAASSNRPTCTVSSTSTVRPAGKSSCEVGTGALLAHDRRRRQRRATSHRQQQAADAEMGALTSSMDRIAALVGAATYVGSDNDGTNTTTVDILPPVPAQQRISAKLWELADAAERERREMSRMAQAERQKVEQEQERAASILRRLIERDQREADRIEERERLERERLEEAERKRLEAERAEEELAAQLEKGRAEEAAAALAQRQRDAEMAQLERVQEEEARSKQKADAKAKLEAEAAKKTEYVTKAKKLINKLVEVRASLEPFESNKAVSRRRLQYKKIVRGRLNTLSHVSDKIRIVAKDVIDAINAARTEDDQIKAQMKETGALADGGLSPDMARGKRYLLDLLCSNVIVRVQAEGFNGTRGDGFPLAALLASVSAEVKELVPLLAAHLYTACPATIPKLPDIADDESEIGLMKGLGMLKGKDGQYETFDRFLARTEGLVSIIANIMASIPSDHILMGGHKGALDWLGRFLDLLPPAPQEPLPLLTAPVLVAFLTGAGHMLANKFPDEFKAHLDTIVNDIAKRLDVGTVGQPSATRLRKILGTGFEGFRTAMPPGAVEAYYDATCSNESVSAPPPLPAPSSAAAVPGSAFGGSSTTGPLGGSTFGSQSTGAPGMGFQQSQSHSQAQGPGSSPFGQTQSTQSGPFGGMSSAPQHQQQQQQTPFGGSSSGTPFLGGNDPTSGGPKPNRPPCRFFAQGKCRNGDSCNFSHELTSGGAQQGNTTGGGMSSANPFGANPGQQSSPFAPPGPSPFGGGASSNQQAAQHPTASVFGQQQTNQAASNPFASTQAPAPSPFGSAQAPAPSPFGSTQAPAPSPFGSTQAPAPSPFRSTQASSAPTPFGSTQAPASSPFGSTQASSAPTPFGSTQAQTSAAPSPFGSGAATDGMSANPSPFGGGLGGRNNNNPFGGGGGGGGGGRSSFGGGLGGGGGPNKPPCKFFAQGRCRNGSNCKFSHESSNSNATFGTFGSGGSGGPAAASNNLFGGLGGGNNFNNNPFGGPRR